jgi:capsular polysaccharide biosynthesis protein
VPRTWWPLAGAVAGLAVALAVTLLQDPTYRADASLVLVRSGQPPGSDPELDSAAEAAAELFESRAVTASALANLGLDETPDELLERLDATAEPGSSLVRIAVEGPDEEAARRAAQEVAVVSTVLYNDRFGPGTSAAVWEQAQADPDRVSPRPARNLTLGALLGALAGWAALLGVGRAPRLPHPPRRPSRPRLPRPRLPARTPGPKRAVAPPSAPSTAREGHGPGPVPGTRPAGTAPPEPAPPPTTPGPFVMPGFGEWTIGDVERLVAEQGPAFPERREEIGLYVDALRGVAGPDGRLPGDVDLVIEDVFADLIAHSGSSRRS